MGAALASRSHLGHEQCGRAGTVTPASRKRVEHRALGRLSGDAYADDWIKKSDSMRAVLVSMRKLGRREISGLS